MVMVSMPNHSEVADLIIIGGGGAGLSAALQAAEAGCRGVVVLEKMSAPGGNTALGGGLFAVESRIQKAQGMSGSRDEAYHIATDWAQWKNDPRVVRAYINKSADTIEWLERRGISFRLHSLYKGQSPVVWHMTSGVDLMRVLRRDCKSLGVRLDTKTTALRLCRTEDEALIEVVALSGAGERAFRARAVVIATGGMGGNGELLKRYFPSYKPSVDYVGRAHNKGEGLLMAQAFGAAIDDQVAPLIEGPNTSPRGTSLPAQGMAQQARGMVGAMFRAVGNLAKVRYVVWVNKAGRRFVSESACPIDMASANAILRQPEGICYAVFDDGVRNLMEERGLVESVGVYAPPTMVTGLKECLGAAQDEGLCMTTGSWDEMAEWIGADSATLSAEIDDYNASCDQGFDPVFNKEAKHLIALRTPPFYAIRCHTLLMDTLGGIRVNERMEVLNECGGRLPGLFAAGVCAGGLLGDLYNYELPGSAQSFAINSGRIAAENAVAYLGTLPNGLEGIGVDGERE
jgi:fumarate reductase flavoprotein subunit